MRLAAARYVRDRVRAAAAGAAQPFVFSPTAANDACDFIEKLPHVEGKWVDKDGNPSPDIILHESHVFFVVQLFGFRQHDGTRRFTQALFAVARKNAKSTLAAAILLYCLCCENEPGPQVISAATTGSQARIIFNYAKKMVEKTPDLREMFSIEPFSSAIVNWQAAGNFKPINAKASTQDGLNPSHTVLDEIHAHKTHDLMNVLKSAAGARLNALWLYTTTEGYETPGPWPEMRHFAKQVLNGLYKDEDADHFLFLIYALDDQEGHEGDPHYKPADDDFDETKWIKANPLMTVNPILAREIRKAAFDAKQMPGAHAEFKIKRLNRQAAGANTWINIDKWKRCNGAVDLVSLEGVKCWGGLDGASTTDLMAFRLLWYRDGIYYTYGWRWVPAEAVAHRTERGTVPYAGWVQAKWITQVPGAAMDHEFVERDIMEICKRFNPEMIGYDPWNLRDLTRRLIAQGVKMEEFRQGSASYHPPMQELENIYVKGNLRTGNDPVLNWCASNLVPRKDANLAMAPDRKRSPDKIDDMCALLMAKGTMGKPTEPPKEFQLLII